MNALQLKKELFLYCKAYADARGERIQRQIEILQEGLQSETKSSAGDKHETGRAMLQLEREKLGQQFALITQMKTVLHKIKMDATHAIVHLGSLVHTTRGSYYLAISAGVYELGNVKVFCVSLRTPIGQLLLGKKDGDQLILNGETSTILGIE